MLLNSHMIELKRNSRMSESATKSRLIASTSKKSSRQLMKAGEWRYSQLGSERWETRVGLKLCHLVSLFGWYQTC